MSTDRDKYIVQALEITAKLASLAEEGEAESQDDGCRVLFGVVRDCAYKIRKRAENEREMHRAFEGCGPAGGGNMKKSAWGLIAAIAICSVAWAEDGTWTSDFAKAKSVAVEKNLPILALFTGSDWCPWCKRLNREVLATDEFKTYASENLVLFIADFPQLTRLAPEIAKQNQELSDKYQIEGFPTVVLMNAVGKELGRTGYQEGGGKAYVGHIKGLLKKR